MSGGFGRKGLSADTPANATYGNSPGTQARFASAETNLLPEPTYRPTSDPSMLVAYALWWFGAFVAAHRFYLGAHRSALIMFGLFWGGFALVRLATDATSGFSGIVMLIIYVVWVIVDIFLIPGLTRRRREQQRAESFARGFD
jgi:TM2 domain-containing membrane protein YozV